MTNGSSGRREDPPLLTGSAEYTDDRQLPGMLYAGIVRSQHAHARIESVDTSAATARDGVVAAFTGGDLAASGVPGNVPAWFTPPTAEDDPVYSLEIPFRVPHRGAMATDTVRHAGEPVAVVLAEDRYTAAEAASRVEIDSRRLDAVVDPVSAVEGSGVQLHEVAPGNVAVDWRVGDADAVAAAFERAEHTVEYSLSTQRLIPNAVEPRSIVADFDPEPRELTVRMSTQAHHHVRRLLADSLDLPEDRIRVRAPAVGGGFGTKSKSYPAEVIVAWCSMQVGRPVKWVATRPESYLAGIHGREHETEAALALDRDGRIRALRVETHANVGAYVSKATPEIVTAAYGRMLSGVYDIPAIHARVIGAFTNTAPVDAYRGAGRPQATYVLERGVALAARDLGIDPVTLRRRNLFDPDSFPVRTAVGATYGSGDYETAMDRALELAGYGTLRERQRRLRAEGRCVGVGIATFVEETGVGAPEASRIRVDPSGTVTAAVGTADHGQGHHTTFARLIADELGVPEDAVEVETGDTGLLAEGTGSFASRSVLAGGNSLRESVGEVIEQGRAIAADRLEADPTDVEYDSGEFYLNGVPDRSISLGAVAAAAAAGAGHGLDAQARHTPAMTYPFGAHVVFVEVDPNDGGIDIERYAAVHDCGVQLDPAIVEGQVHGAIVQGIGQALYEEAVYDTTGNLLTGSLQDYTVPRAAQVPELDVEFTVTPARDNPLGVKGVGENGTLGPPAAIVNAVVDALEPLGVRHLETPLTAETVWRALDR